MAGGYRFTPLFGVRGGLSGLWARNSYENSDIDWHFNFLQGVKYTVGKSHGCTESVYE